MIPILYEKGETAFTSNGLGRLSDAVNCHVSEILNGEYELSMTYPSEGLHADLLENDRLILAEPEDGMDPEPFRIYSVTKTMNGSYLVAAEHISYWLNSIPVMAFEAGNVASAMAGLKTNAAEACPFNFYTDRGTQGTFKVTTPKSIRSCLGGSAGSLLDVYGHGEYWFNRFDVHFNLHRGQNRNVVIRYGKNLTDLNQEKNIESIFTGICPFWAGQDGTIVTLPEKVINTTAASAFSFSRTQVVDLSDKFETAPTAAQLRTAAEAYITANGVGVPAISITVSFAALWQTIEYENIAPLERVYLGDTVTVLFEKLGIEATAQVVRVNYDVLKGRFTEIELGSVRPSFADTYVNQVQKTDKAIEDTAVVMDQKIAQAAAETDQKIADLEESVGDDIDQAIATAKQQIQQDIDDAIAESEQQMDQEIQTATNAITGNNGGYVLIHDSNGNGKPDEILVMNTESISTATKLWRWNLSGLGYSSSGYNGTYGLAMTMDGKINASFITTGTLNASLITVTNLSATSITSGTLKDSGNNFVLNMSTGALTAKKLSVTSTNFTLTEAGVVWMQGADITGKITASSGKIGIFDIDSDNGIKFLGREVASNTSSPYVLVQLYRSRLRFWYNTTSTGAFQNGTKEIFGVQYSAINRNCFVTGVGYYSTGDVVSDSYIMGGSGSNNYFTLQRNGSTTNPAVMRFFKFDSSSLSYKKTIDISGEGEIIQPYTGGHSSTSASGTKRQIRIAEGKRIELDYGLDQNNSSYGDLPELVITAWNNFTGNIDTQVISNAYQLQAPYIVQTSDRKLKDLIEDMDADKVKRVYEKLRPRKYIYKSDHESVRRRYGLIAQEVLDALATVGINEDDTRLVDLQNRTDGTEFYALCYDMLHAFHISMIQQLEKRIEDLEAQLKGGAE